MILSLHARYRLNDRFGVSDVRRVEAAIEAGEVVAVHQDGVHVRRFEIDGIEIDAVIGKDRGVVATVLYPGRHDPLPDAVKEYWK